nr:hypothetical protein [Tanacetum cinerariifolium]
MYYCLYDTTLTRGIRKLNIDCDMVEFMRISYENDKHMELFTEHHGYDVLKYTANDNLVAKNISDYEELDASDYDGEFEPENVDFHTEGEQGVHFKRLSTDDPFLTKLVGNGNFIGARSDPMPNLIGNYNVEEDDPEVDIIDPIYKVVKGKTYLVYDPEECWKENKPVLGMRYENPKQLKHALSNYGVARGYKLWYYETDSESLLAYYGKDTSIGRCAGKNKLSKIQEKDKEKGKGKIGENDMENGNGKLGKKDEENGKRCDNGTEFKNHDLNQLCGIKGIKREFSVARTQQQNGVAERKNKTLIEAARTMLAESLLPISFCTEAVNTTCYVQNRSMNYQPVVAGNQPNHNAGIKENLDSGKGRKETISAQQYMMLPLWSIGFQNPQNTYTDVADATFDVKEVEMKFMFLLVEVTRLIIRNMMKKAKRDDKGKSLVDALVNVDGPNPTNSTNSFDAASPSDTVVRPSGYQVLEVRKRNKAYGVNLIERSCFCKLWDLSRILCVHAVAAYMHLYMDPELGFSKHTLLPPIIQKMLGRPKKKRVRHPTENDYEGGIKISDVDGSSSKNVGKGTGSNVGRGTRSNVGRSGGSSSKRGGESVGRGGGSNIGRGGGSVGRGGGSSSKRGGGSVGRCGGLNMGRGDGSNSKRGGGSTTSRGSGSSSKRGGMKRGWSSSFNNEDERQLALDEEAAR